MKYEVTRKFIDKETEKVYEIGSSFETNNSDRAAELKRGGFIEPQENSTVEKVQVVKTTNEAHSKVVEKANLNKSIPDPKATVKAKTKTDDK